MPSKDVLHRYKEKTETIAARTKNKLLLIGDSIRRSYQPLVTEILGRQCEVVGVDMDISCKSTRVTLDLFDDVIEGSEATIIHWNNGLHDIKKDSAEDGHCTVQIDEYESNLEELYSRLFLIAPGKIIWARTTPVIEERHNCRKSFIRHNRDIDAYNGVADSLMKRHNVPINDLHTVIAGRAEEYICEDGVHFTDTGVGAAAGKVVEAVQAYLR